MLMELVKKLNVTVISAIHDLNIAAAYCDKIYVLKDGVLEGYGTPEEVLTPELIRRIYKVEAEIVYDSRGKMHILFYDSGCEAGCIEGKDEKDRDFDMP